MQEDVARRLCLLAFLLSSVRANQNSQDLNFVQEQSHLLNNVADLKAAVPLENRRFQELEDQEKSNSFNSDPKSGAVRLQDRRAADFEGQGQSSPFNTHLMMGAVPLQDRRELGFEGQQHSDPLNTVFRSGAVPLQERRFEGQEQSQSSDEDLRSGALQDRRFLGLSGSGLPNSGFVPLGSNSAPDSPYESLYSSRTGYPGSIFGNAEAIAQAQATAEGLTLAQGQSQAQSLATAKTVAKGFAGYPSLIRPGLYNTLPTSNTVNAPTYTGVASPYANLVPGLGFGKNVPGVLGQANLPTNVLFDAPSVVYGNDPSAVSLAGARSRVIQTSEYIRPHLLPGGENVVTCTRLGQQHYLWSPSHNCMICSCIREFTSLTAVCVSCADCASVSPNSDIVPPVPEIITPVPIPQPLDEGSCSPLPTDEPFQNPLDPCQVCICTKAFNLNGKLDVQVKCEESPQCVIPPGVKPLPPSPITPGLAPPIPFLQDSFQPELIPPIQPISNLPLNNMEPFPLKDPMQTGLSPYALPNLPNFEQVPPSAGQLEPIVPTPFPVPQSDELIPWPPQTLPGPLPGPRPHDSCRPYPPNQYFLHPWDSCQICICSEASVLGLVSVEVNCQTRKECQCVDVPQQSLAPPLSLPTTSIPIPNQMKYLDDICRFRSFGAEFTHPQDSCRLCSCEHFSDLIVPVCRRSNKPGLPFPSEEIIFIEPKCRNQQPNQPFLTDCKVCSCSVVFNYVVARCSPSPDCVSAVTPGTNAYNNAEAAAVAHALTSPRPGLQSTAIPLSYLSGSQSQAEASASAHSSSIAQGSQFQYPSSYPFGRNPSLAESSAIAQSSALAQDYQPPHVFPQTYQSLVPFGGSHSESHANAFGSSSMYNPIQFPSQKLDAEFVSHPGYILPSDATVLNQPQMNTFPYSLDSSQGYLQNMVSPYIQGLPFYPQGNMNVYPYTENANSIAASSLYPSLYPRPSSRVTGLYSPLLRLGVDHGDFDAQ